MDIEEYEEFFGIYEEEMENLDNVIFSYATKEECETLLGKCKNEERRQKEIERKQREIEESKWKKVKVFFELEGDERYCYYNNRASLELYVDKNWSEKRIINYVKKHMWTSVYDEDDGYY